MEGETVTNEAGTDKSSIDETVLALGKLSKALETVERARGRLFDFHQLSGEADHQLGMAAVALDEAGHHDEANRLREVLVGRNVLPGRWTFQIVEEYDADYYRTFTDLERETRGALGVDKHAYEAALKRVNVTDGRPGHELTPDEA
jgi:hypothetical protein